MARAMTVAPKEPEVKPESRSPLAWHGSCSNSCMTFSKSGIALSLLSALLCSCAKPKDAASPPNQEAETVLQTAEKPVPPPDAEGTIQISRTIKKACGLSDSEAHFSYDSSTVRDSDSSILNKVAVCFVTGPLSGEKMNLVGRADPRGEPEYNVVLGGSRSENVKLHLVSQGMNADSILATSRGELDATGDDEAGWREDRRVDVRLASEL